MYLLLFSLSVIFIISVIILIVIFIIFLFVSIVISRKHFLSPHHPRTPKLKGDSVWERNFLEIAFQSFVIFLFIPTTSWCHGDSEALEPSAWRRGLEQSWGHFSSTDTKATSVPCANTPVCAIDATTGRCRCSTLAHSVRHSTSLTCSRSKSKSTRCGPCSSNPTVSWAYSGRVSLGDYAKHWSSLNCSVARKHG